MFTLLAQNPSPLGGITGFTTGFTATAANPADRLSFLISNIVTTFTIFGGLAFLLYFIIGALTWITSAGEAEKLNKAKGQMSTAIVGLLVIVISIPIIYLLGKATGIDIINFENTIERLTP